MELKPCPFCGKEAKASQSTTHNRVYCKGCMEMTEAYNIPEQAASEWNRRAEKVGRWIEEEYVSSVLICKLCGEIQDYETDYYPNCGARMEGNNG